MIAGRYSLDREIGRGGMGAVWLGHDDVLGRQVALKRIGLMPGASTTDLARAEREARLAAMLNHPHVVAVFDLVKEDEQHWLVMEYVDGESLAEVLRRVGPMGTDRVVPLAAQCADALAVAHEEGIVHRDVKPSNILVTRDGQAKLTDFGIARATADPALTQTGLVTGSPAYLAPEVASGQTATAASDVWSLGATVFHALAGRPPYDVGDNLMGGLYRIVHEEPPRLRDAGPLETLLEATMVREPEQRWSIEQVRDHLAALERGDSTRAMAPVAAAPTVAETPPPAPDTRRTEPAPAAVAPAAPPHGDRRRRRGWLVPLVLAVAVLLALLGVGSMLADDEGAPEQTTAQEPDATQSDTRSPSPDQTSESPDEPTPAEVRTQMEQFVTDYLATAPEDPRATFQQLTPEFQEESGGLDGYTGFWGDIASAEPVSITADPETLRVSYTVHYVRGDGSETDDRTRLQLVRSGDGFQIAGEA